jgi:DNA (cytosine-5)-methyltransferase 1
VPALSPKLSKVDDYPAFLDACWQEHLAPRAADAPTVISTFAGAGGSSLGYSMAGFRELLAVEWDDNAVATFRLNFPDVPVYHGDIAKLSVEDVLQRTGLQPGQLDVFDGSPPCQGFSTAGKRDFYDDRNQLFREYVRLLQGLQPKVLIMENVSGMVKGKMKLVFADILRELKASGYRVSARLLNAMYFNVPQSRERMIFVGVRDDLGIEPSHPQAVSMPIVFSLAVNGLSSTIKDESIAHVWVDAKQGSKTLDALLSTPQGCTLKGFSMSRRIHSEMVCPTIQTGGVAPGYPGSSWLSHPVEHRGISTREAARCASFPDAYEFNNWRDGAKRIGNSVPPLFMRSIALHVRREILSETPVLI